MPNAAQPSLTPAHIQQLNQQPFSAAEPGTILKDFTALLDFIAAKPVPLSGKNRLFAMTILPELNRLLTLPLDVKLQRPQQKSFPHLNGLYLLLRMSGLTRVEMDGKQAVMRLNETQMAIWATLHPAERYFALLQAWCRRGGAELIGERSNWLGGDFYLRIAGFFAHLLGGGSGIGADGKIVDIDRLRYRPGMYNLALLQMFGFVAITQGAPLKNETWPVTEVLPTTWGEAVFAFFASQLDADPTTRLDDNDDEIADERWVQALKPYIPAWQNDLPELGGGVVTEGSYLLKVSVGDAYRKIAAPATASLDDLAYCILDAFHFDDDHLYEFVYKNRYGIGESVAHPACDNDHPLCTEDCTLGHLPLEQGSELVFHYDFGDDWRFQIVVETATTEKSRLKAPKIVERHGMAPKQYPDW